MRSQLLTALFLLILIAVGARALTRSEKGSSPVGEADMARARALLEAPPLPAAENERRLVFYNSLRDRMDAAEYGVLEAVAMELRKAPQQRVSPGFDLRTFYSAVGGDRDFRGGGDEDWARLVAFQDAWLEVHPGSAAARLARAQARLGSFPAQESLGEAIACLQAVQASGVREPYLPVVGNRALQAALGVRDVGRARQCYELLGDRVDPVWEGHRAGVMGSSPWPTPLGGAEAEPPARPPGGEPAGAPGGESR